MVRILSYLLIGFSAGTISGLIGIGGGIIITPLLILLFEFSQHTAQGTTLALMVPPIGILAAYTYYKSGHVDVNAAIYICISFVIGGLIGSKFAMTIPRETLQRIFGFAMIIIGFYMIFRK
ncbi:MAG: sulfite exporter TauE/SafE family protein [bacterium]